MKINWHKSVVLFGLMALAASAYSKDNDSKIVDPGQQFFQKSYNQLASEWTNWLGLEPAATNPAFDADGRYCGLNQKGKVWFLAGTFEGVADRTCVIPAGKAIFFSLGGVWLSFAPEFPESGDSCLQFGTTVEKVRCDVNKDIAEFVSAPNRSFEMALDGTAVNDLFAYRTQSQPGGFTLRVPNPSLLTDSGYSAGDRTPAVSDGYYMYLKPLKPGKHALNFAVINPDQSKSGVNYTLIIKPDDAK
jgi:hypothetical protein